FLRKPRAYYQGALAVAIPPIPSERRHTQIQRRAVGRLYELQVGAAGIGCAAQDDDALVVPFQVGRYRVGAHVGIDRDGVSLIALEGFARILLRCRSDVAALGVQNNGQVRVVFTYVVTQSLQLVFRALGREVSDLRLDGAGVLGGYVDDGAAELEDGVGVALQFGGKALRVGIQAHCQHRTGRCPGLGQLFNEGHVVLTIWIKYARL